MKWLIRKYMAEVHIDTFKELSKMTGLAERNLRKKMLYPANFRLFEIMALDKVLHFQDEDLVMLVRGKI